MQPSVRLLSREALSSKSFYVCSTCRREVIAHGLSPLSHQVRRYASSDSNSFLDRTRRRLWGADKPPGLEDPYGGEGQIARSLRKTREKLGVAPTETDGDALGRFGDAELDSEAQSEGRSRTSMNSEDPYIQATTWTNLPEIGYLPEKAWELQESTKADNVTPFLTESVYGSDRINDLARQAATEICLMHILRKPLAKVCDIETHVGRVNRYLDSCTLRAHEPGDWSTAIWFPSVVAKNLLFYAFKQIGGDTAANSTKASESENDTTTQIMEAPQSGKRKRSMDFLNLSLADPMTKFAFVKRFSQLTGRRFPDPVINSAATIDDCVQHLLKRKKAPRVHNKLKGKRGIGKLHNFKFYGCRTPATFNDEEVGRQKLIVAALHTKGLDGDPSPTIPRKLLPGQTRQ